MLHYATLFLYIIRHYSTSLCYCVAFIFLYFVLCYFVIITLVLLYDTLLHVNLLTLRTLHYFTLLLCYSASGYLVTLRYFMILCIIRHYCVTLYSFTLLFYSVNLLLCFFTLLYGTFVRALLHYVVPTSRYFILLCYFKIIELIR